MSSPNYTQTLSIIYHALFGVRQQSTRCSDLRINHFKLAIGDCAVASGFLSYLGPFGKEMREHLLQNTLVGGCQKLGVPYSQDLHLPLFLSSDSEMGEWKLQVPSEPAIWRLSKLCFHDNLELQSVHY